jgi:hypothetical protein
MKGVNWDSRLHLFEKMIFDFHNLEIVILDSVYYYDEIGIMGF